MAIVKREEFRITIKVAEDSRHIVCIRRIFGDNGSHKLKKANFFLFFYALFFITFSALSTAFSNPNF